MVESADAVADELAEELDDAASAKAERACSVMRSADAVGMTMGAVPVRSARSAAEWLAAELVLDAADRKTPFPGELTVGFAQAAAEHVGSRPQTDHEPPFPKGLAVGFPGKLKEKGGGDEEARFPDGLG